MPEPVAPPTGLRIQTVAIGANQYHWRPLLSTAAQGTSAAALSGAGAYLNLTAWPSPSADAIIVSAIEPASIARLRFYAQGAENVNTATARIFGISEVRGQPIAGVDAHPVEVREYSADALFDMAFIIGATETGSTTKLRPYNAGSPWRWIDIVAISNDRLQSPGARVIVDSSIGPTDGASQVLFDNPGYCGFIVELRIGVGVTAIGGEYSLV